MEYSPVGQEQRRRFPPGSWVQTQPLLRSVGSKPLVDPTKLSRWKVTNRTKIVTIQDYWIKLHKNALVADAQSQTAYSATQTTQLNFGEWGEGEMREMEEMENKWGQGIWGTGPDQVWGGGNRRQWKRIDVSNSKTVQTNHRLYVFKSQSMFAYV